MAEPALGLITAAALFRGCRSEPAPGASRARFLVLIPAHNEQEGIAATVASCRATDYDPRLVRILVIADNCTDDTAEFARRAGAEVVE